MTNKLMLFVLCTFCFFSCEKESALSDFVIGTPFNIPFAGTNHTPDDEVTVNFFEVVSDSRCPSDVTCVWEGESSVKLNLKIGAESEDLILSTHLKMGQGPQKDTIGGYIISLLEVTPYPISTVDVPEEDYEIRLQIDEL